MLGLLILAELVLPAVLIRGKGRYAVLVSVILLTIGGGIFHTRTGNLFDKVSIFSLQSIYLCLKHGNLALAFRNLTIQFGGVDARFGDTRCHSTLLGVLTDTTATAAALVLGTAFT